VLTRWIATGFLFCGLSLLTPVAAESVVLARIDGVPITLDDLKEDFQRRHQGHMSILADEEVVRDFLKAAVKRRLFIAEGRRMELQHDADIVERVDAERVRIATSWLHRSEVTDRVRVTEADLEAAMPQALQAHEIIHIRTDTADAAERARKQIVSGVIAETVAREFSVAKSRLRGGLEGIGWGALDRNFEEAIAATAEGEIAGPVETDEGWELALVIAHKDVETDTQKLDPIYVRSVLERRRTEELRTRFLDGLREIYGARIDETLLEPAVLVPLLEEGAAIAEEQRVLATYTGGAIRLADFVQTIRPRAFLALRPGQQKRQAGQLLANQLDEALLGLESVRRWDKAPTASLAKLAWFENDLVFRSLLGRVVFGDLSIADEEITDYLEAHREDYVTPAKVRFGIALLSSEEDARSFLEDFRSGTSFAELARERSEDNSTAARGGDAGWIEANQAIEPLRGAPFESAAGTAGGPIRLEAGWLVYTVLERREPTPLPEQKAREEIQAELMRRASEERMHHWEQQLRSVAKVKINDKGLRKAVKIIQEEREEKRLEKKPTRGASPHGGHS